MSKYLFAAAEDFRKQCWQQEVTSARATTPKPDYDEIVRRKQFERDWDERVKAGNE